MLVVVIGARKDDKVYEAAQRRIYKFPVLPYNSMAF